MNFSVKRCLLGLVALSTMFGIAQAQLSEPTGTVQLGPQAFSGGPAFPPGPAPDADFGSQPVPSGTGSTFGMTRVDRVFAPRVNIDSRGGGLYGYDAGYSNIGVFAPYKLEEDAILFVHGMGMVTYDGRGGASVGTGWRYWMEGLDRIVGLSVWFDFDNGHAQPYQQVGLSFESLGRYVDYRINGYIPISNPDHVLYSQLSSNSFLYGSGIGLIRNNTIEQSYTGFDAEMGGPTPILGRYGLNAYIGGYFFTGNGQHGGNFTGVSGRLLSQINEDVSFGVQVTDDAAFGLNTQFQVFVNLPDGRPSRWMRNPRVHDRLNQNVFRQNRVMAKTDSFQTVDLAIDPTTHRPYFVANINPNLGLGGNGTANSPFGSVAQYESVSAAQRQQYGIILVQSRAVSTSTNLDTTKTLELFDGQRLLSTSIAHNFTTANLPGVNMNMPGYTGGPNPKLFNGTGGDVITLAGGNSRGMEVSGFNITGSATGNGIRGNNNQNVNINNNEIQGGLNGVLLTNLSGTIAAGTESQFVNNNVHDNLGNGIQVTNAGSPPFVTPLDVVVQSNTFNSNANDGLQLVAQAGGSISGIIGGPSGTATTASRSNLFENNGANGLNLIANGGRLNFLAPPAPIVIPVPGSTTKPLPPLFGVPFDAPGIYNNVFIGNKLDGLHISTTNNSISSFNVINNNFGYNPSDPLVTSGNQRYGIGLESDSGTTLINIGGPIVTYTDGTTFNPGNTFKANAVSAINLAVGGTGTLSYDISNNTISNGATPTVAAPHDAFKFSFNGTSGTDPFTITNNSDAGIDISSVIWNLAGTPATIAGTNQGTAGNINPVVLQPISDSLLTSLNNRAVTAGTSPLLMSPGNNPATNLNSGLAKGSQLLPMGFTGFAPASVFNATSRFELSTGSSPLSSAATNGSFVSVNFSNGLQSVAQVAQLTPGSIAVSASGDAYGTAIPGYGQGGDGIHVIASGNSALATSNIHDNSVTGYGGFGIHVETAGSAKAPNVIIQNNQASSNGIGVNGAGVPVFSGGGVKIEQRESSTLNALLASNKLDLNFNDGVVVAANGTATGSLNVYSRDNNGANNAGNGLRVTNAGAGNLTFSSNRDNFSGNGSGSGTNTDTTSGDNLAFVTGGTSVTNINLHNVLGNNSSSGGLTSGGLPTGNGLSATTNDGSTLNLLIDSPKDPLFTGVASSFSNEKVNGIVLNSNGTSYMHASIYDTFMNGNGVNGILFNRSSASLVRANIVNSSMSGNGVNGLAFYGLGSDPQDPNQQFSGSPNRINLIQDALNNNGANGVGQGVRLDLLGDSELVLNANATTFNNNAQNGLRISLDPGAQFGYTLGNERSTLDNVQINNNGSNGIFLTSTITPTDPNSNNAFLPLDAPSLTFMQVSANTGNTSINNNGFGANATGLNGILMQYLGGNHDVLIEGDVAHATPLYATVIQGNKNDGIHSESGIQANPTLTVESVIIGGPLALNANGGDGIDFEVQARLTIVDGASTTNWAFNGAGYGNINVNNSLVQGNQGNGINLIGNDFTDVLRTSNGIDDVNGLLNATITNSEIVNNKLSGVNILLEGRMGEYRMPGFDTTGKVSTITLANNSISSNGEFGVKMEQNAGIQPDVFVDFFSPKQTDPATPFNPRFMQPTTGTNTGNNTDLLDGYLLSNWMNLWTDNNAKLVMTNNNIQFNGMSGNLRAADGVYIRVSSDSYLAADIRNNTISGNVANDVHIESFTQYNPVTGVAYIPAASGPKVDGGLSRVYLDYTAQMDLRFTGNVGNSLNIQNPLVNSFANLQGNSTPNGAFMAADPYKDRYSYDNPRARLVQLFQVDDGGNLNSKNLFSQNGITEDVYDSFYNADFHLRTVADPLFPNPLFPQDYFSNPGDPFLP